MALVDVKGVRVNFPFKPYPCQVTYMEKVLECLQTGKNGVLESPTGTGKTLCLLCSSLAWLENRKEQVDLKLCAGAAAVASDAGKENREDCVSASFFASLHKAASSTSWGSDEFVVPKIIYASRTHSQLSQAIQELKRTAYNGMKTAIIGSRDQLCVNEQVKKEKNNNSKVRMCRAKVGARQCHYYNVLEDLKSKTDARQVVGSVTDIEDLVLHGSKSKVCPYYLARELKSDANIIFMPYNYLLDPKTRKAHGIELQGNIIIFDEAHNLERICEESASFDLSSVDLATAIEETTQLGIKLTEMATEEADLGDTGDGAVVPEFTLTDVIKLKQTLLDLEQLIDGEPLAHNGATRPGMFMFELMEKVNITYGNKNFVIDLMDKMISHLNSDVTASALQSKGTGLSKIFDALKVIFNCEPMENSCLSLHKESVAQHYKVHIQVKEKFQTNKKIDSWASTGAQDKAERVLSYWCFNPGYSMQDLKAQGVKSIILTSGTLSPIDSFTAEMQIPFTVRLENPHVIEKNQVWVGTLGSGPDGSLLNSNYQNRFSESYKSTLGNAIVNFARIVPKGLLVFFPSYPVMESCVESWQNGNIWDRIMTQKPVVLEPRGKDAFTAAIDDFYQKINDTHSGAVFMAVCRGKVSEGLDFADMNGRAVMITGLPYPPMKDPRVILKMQHLDGLKGKQGSVSLSGQQWYRQQATRAVNQAIGRVIRHKDDFGAIILCDSRFSSPESVNGLPKWVKCCVTKCDNFGRALKDIRNFFKVAEETLPAPKVRCIRQKDADSSGSGCSGAFFEPMISRRTFGVEHASSVACHVPGFSRQSLEDTVSSLKSQYSCPSRSGSSDGQKRGLLQALDASEKSTAVKSFSFPGDKASSDVETARLPQKKKRIIIKPKNAAKPSVSSKPECPAVDVGNMTTSSGIAVQKTGVYQNMAENYLTEVKSVLTESDYKRFSSTLREYKKSGCLKVITPVLADLFTSHSDHFTLFRRFYRFVRPMQRAEFDLLCVSLTGESCGYKPEDALSGKRLFCDSQPVLDGKRRKLVSASSSGSGLGQWSATSCTSTVVGVPLMSRVSGTANDDGTSSTCSSASSNSSHAAKQAHFSASENLKMIQSSGSKSNSTAHGVITGDSSRQTLSNLGISADKHLDIISLCTDNAHKPTALKNISDKDIQQSTISAKCPDKSCDRSCSVKSSLAGQGSGSCCSGAGNEAVSQPPCEEATLDIDVEKLRMMSRGSNKPSSKSGYRCCKCKKEANLPFRLDPCEHVCCFKCWRGILEGDKQCPGDCGHMVKRRNLKQLQFVSGRDFVTRTPKQ